MIRRYDERLFIKPGMTGLAQIHYRYDQTLEDVKKKLRFDLLYVKRMCLMLDARILAWTVLVVFTGRGIR
jgi:lipopolysaccharide/colanic/teichoic acid biosynthesis glycosyltransferase